MVGVVRAQNTVTQFPWPAKKREQDWQTTKEKSSFAAAHTCFFIQWRTGDDNGPKSCWSIDL